MRRQWFGFTTATEVPRQPAQVPFFAEFHPKSVDFDPFTAAIVLIKGGVLRHGGEVHERWSVVDDDLGPVVLRGADAAIIRTVSKMRFLPPTVQAWLHGRDGHLQLITRLDGKGFGFIRMVQVATAASDRVGKVPIERWEVVVTLRVLALLRAEVIQKRCRLVPVLIELVRWPRERGSGPRYRMYCKGSAQTPLWARRTKVTGHEVTNVFMF